MGCLPAEWIVDGDIRLSLAAAGLAPAAPAYVHVVEAHLAVIQAAQLVEKLLPYGNSELIQKQTASPQMTGWEAVGVSAAKIMAGMEPLLTAVNSHTQAALTHVTQSNLAYAYLEAALKSIGQASALVQKLVTFANDHGQAGEEPASGHSQIDITGPIRESVDLVTAVLSPNISLVPRLAASLPPVAGNAHLFRLLGIELLVNVVETAVLGDGEIITTTGVETLTVSDHYFVGGEPPASGDYVYFRISDTGKVRAEASMAHIFRPLFNTQGGRAGLGLPVAVGIVRSAHGAIRIQSQTDQDATLDVLFPVS